MRWPIALILFGLILAVVRLAFQSGDTTPADDSAQFFHDPRVVEMVERPQRCQNAEHTYAWICGAVIKMPGASASKVCTSQDEPLFAGKLSLPGESFFYGSSLQWSYNLPLQPLVPCTANWPENTNSCATVALTSMTTNGFGGFDELPPFPLPDGFPTQGFESSGHTSAPDYFAGLNGDPVALIYTEFIGDKNGAAPNKCLLQKHIGPLNLRLELNLPCVSMDRWQGELQAVVDAIQSNIISSDGSADCGMPPANALIKLNRFHTPALENMSIWLDIYR